MKSPSITIEFQLREQEGSTHLQLSAAEYFDPLEEGETWDDAVPRHSFAYEYLDVPVGKLAWLVLTEIKEGGWSTARYQFLSGTDDLLVHTEESDGASELIHTAQVSEADCHITRILRPAGKNWTVTVDTVIDEDEETRKLDEWEWVDKIAFADVGCDLRKRSPNG